ncbi:MAG TPA: glycerophosphodiester phosphodiesterase [Symbiobacteriaceae bacterium]|nr:glycerophosphodiester phosphodiesterase [Symbiobacteriaceae bacterium]
MSMNAAPAPASRRRPRWLAVGLAAVLLLAVVRMMTVEPRTPKPYLEGRLPTVLAHQGASGHAPSNTLESFRLGMEMGADVIETDVHMTRDGIIVTSHDESIDRLTNGHGLIKEMTLAELRQFDFGYGFTPDGGKTYPYRGKGVSIPTLEEVFKTFPGVPVNIELKQEEPVIESKVWDLIRQYQMEDKVLINSFHSGPMERWREIAGERAAQGATKSDMYGFVAFYLPYLDRLYQPKVDALQLPVSQNVGPFTIHFDTERMIKTAHRMGLRVHYWTINDEETMRHLVQIGADGIISDYPDRVVKVLKEEGLR